MSPEMRIYVFALISGVALGIGIGLMIAGGIEGWKVAYMVLIGSPIMCLAAMIAQRGITQIREAKAVNKPA